MENKTKTVVILNVIGIAVLIILGMIIFNVFRKKSAQQITILQAQVQMHLKEIDALRKEKETNKLPAQAAEAEQLNNEIGAVLKEKGAEAGTTPTQEEINEAVKRLDESRNANK